MKLRPSEAMLLIPGGSVPVPVPLWETEAGDLVWPRLGIKGNRLPAGCASGLVPCKWADPPELIPLDMTGGCPKGGFVEVEAAVGVGRQLVIRAPDGPQEVKLVMVYEQLELADV